MAPLVRRTWAPKGNTPILYQKTRSYRKVSVIAALTLSPQYQRVGLYFSLRRDANFTTPAVLRFLKALLRQLQRPMIILWDRLQAHRSVAVRLWLEKHPIIRTEFFPSYAPELNPVEPLWGYLNLNSAVRTEKPGPGAWFPAAFHAENAQKSCSRLSATALPCSTAPQLSVYQ